MAQRVRTSPAASAKPRYRVTNWRDYNRALVELGSITLWIDQDVLDGWRATGGKGWRYSNLAILTALMPLDLAAWAGTNHPRSEDAARCFYYLRDTTHN